MNAWDVTRGDSQELFRTWSYYETETFVVLERMGSGTYGLTVTAGPDGQSTRTLSPTEMQALSDAILRIDTDPYSAVFEIDGLKYSSVSGFEMVTLLEVGWPPRVSPIHLSQEDAVALVDAVAKEEADRREEADTAHHYTFQVGEGDTSSLFEVTRTGHIRASGMPMGAIAGFATGPYTTEITVSWQDFLKHPSSALGIHLVVVSASAEDVHLVATSTSTEPVSRIRLAHDQAPES